MPQTPPSIAATSTLAMVRTAEARGFAVADLLERAGLRREFLDDPDARLPAPTVVALWAALRERTADPTLQLAAPCSLPFGAYRVIDYLVGASATVGDGIERFAGFFRLIADAVTLRTETDAHEHCLVLATRTGGAVPAIYVDYVFAALVSRIRMRIRPTLAVARVELQQPEPANPAAWGELFAAPVLFGASADRLCFTDDEWHAPMHTADSHLAGVLEEHARLMTQRLPQATAGFSADVHDALTAALPEGGSAEAVARALHMSVRTLQRKLVAAGTTFRELADAVRMQLAAEQLADATVSTAEVAFLLGFSDQTSFNRAFRRWTGQSPGRWRRSRPPALTLSQGPRRA
jgi:AraC-like DNA-binding protein